LNKTSQQLITHTALRDALVADSISEEQRDMAFSFHHASDAH
jgi:hypothetical protein